MNKLGYSAIRKHEQELVQYTIKRLQEIPHCKIYSKPTGPVSFNIFDDQGNLIHPHDVSSLLDEEGICVRGGHLCAQPLMKKLNVPGVVRISIYVYNDKEDIDVCINALYNIQKMFSNTQEKS